MNRITVMAVALLMGTAVAAYAAPRGVDRGASGFSPGDRMHDQGMKGKGGASRFAPGRMQRTPGGASELSPGDRMNDTRGR